MKNSYRPGSHYVIDDRTGARIRVEDARQEWNGAVVHRDEFEERHPQEFVRGRVDRQVAEGVKRPEPVDVLVGPLRTTIAGDCAAGATTIPVASSVRMAIGDRVTIMLDNGEAFQGQVQNVPDAQSIVLLAGLPWPAASGNEVLDDSAIAEADLG